TLCWIVNECFEVLWFRLKPPWHNRPGNYLSASSVHFQTIIINLFLRISFILIMLKNHLMNPVNLYICVQRLPISFHFITIKSKFPCQKKNKLRSSRPLPEENLFAMLPLPPQVFILCRDMY